MSADDQQRAAAEAATPAEQRPRSLAQSNALHRLWRSRAFRLLALAAVFVAPVVPWVDENSFVVGWALTSAMVGLSMNVLAGYAGQISLAHAVLYGSGAFAIGNLVTRAEVPWLIALPLAGLITAAIALLIGFPALRIRGLHLAIATLGFQFVMQRVVFRTQFLTGGASGVDIERPHFLGFDFNDNTAFLWLILSALVAIWLIDRNLTRSKTGRAFFALRQDEQVAQSFGINVARYKLLAFAISGFYAGIAGALFGTLQGDVTNELFDFIFSIEFLVFAVLGGLGSRGGTAVGAAFPVMYRNILSFLRALGPVLGGLLLVFTLLRYEGGMAAQGREIKESGELLRKRGPMFFAVFFGILAVTLSAAIITPFFVWYLADLVGIRLTTFPIIAIGLATAVLLSLFLEKKVKAAAISKPEGGSKMLIMALGLIGTAGVALAGVFGTQFLLSLAGLIENSTATFPAYPLGALITALLYAGLMRSLSKDTGPPASLIAEFMPAPPAETSGDSHLAEAASTLFQRGRRREPYRGALLQVDDLAMHFGGVKALDGVSLEVREGELIGIMGPNGSGKTTMLNCVSGFLTPTRGEVRFRGESVLGKAPHDRAALGLGRTFQNVGLVKQETVFDNFIIAQHLACGYGAMEGLIRTGGVLNEERRLRARAEAAVEMLGLTDIVREQVRALPHGRAKLVELGCALVTGPELLLLDEPAAGVSPQEADQLGDRLKEIAAHFGVTILMIEHHVPLMLQTCDYIYVLNFGQLLTHGEPGEVAAHPDVIAAYLGTTGKEASVAASLG